MAKSTGPWEWIHRISSIHTVVVAVFGAAIVEAVLRAFLEAIRRPQLPWWGDLSIAVVLAACLMLIVQGTTSRGNKQLTIHYAGWGRGPTEEYYTDVTKHVRGLINGNSIREGVTASDTYFGHHWGGEPRRLSIDYSYGKDAEKKTALFTEHQIVRLPMENEL